MSGQRCQRIGLCHNSRSEESLRPSGSQYSPSKVCGFVEFIDSYLKNRKQFTKLGNKISSEKELHKLSVVKGSLFILFINDIFKILIKGEMFLFADDITLIIKDKSIEKLNDSLNLLSEYFTENRLLFNVKKSYSLIFGTNTESFSPLYLNERIQMKNDIKISGVIIDKKLSFQPHIIMVSKKLSKICSITKRLRYFLPISSLKMIFNSYFIPHLT